MPEPKNDLNALKAGFLQHLTLRNLSPLTVRQQGQYLRIFLNYVRGRGIADVRDVDHGLVEQYKACLSTEYTTTRGELLKPATVTQRLLAVKAWYDWMRKKGAVSRNPVAAVQLPFADKRAPHGVLRQDEVRKIMELPDLRTPLGYRDRTIMEVLYATGARARELVNLRLQDVDLPKRVVRINSGKGRRDRFAPLTTSACRFLARYLGEVRPKLFAGIRPCGRSWARRQDKGEDFVFLSWYGESISSIWLGQVMKRYIRQAGITRPMSPVHGFRHSVATHLIGSGMDVRYVQVLLGHKSINSTQIYTHVERETLHRVMKAHHPRALSGEAFIPFCGEATRAS